jgi:hypothetical protein
MSPPPPDATYNRFHAFIAGVRASLIERCRHDTFIVYTDPFSSSAYIQWSPFTHKLEARGMSMVHFDKLCSLFNTVKGGIEVTELVLEDCTIRASLFYYMMNDNTHSLILKNVRVAEGNLATTSEQPTTPQSPAWWEDVLPIFVHQARLTHCHLESLQDYSSSLANDSGVPTFHSEGSLAIKKGLKALYWDLCWRSWCSDPIEHSLTELYHLSKAIPDPDHRQTDPEKRTVATRSSRTRSASKSSPTPAGRRR